ncbi:MAG: hypothetical protein KAX42_02695, partial [Sphaerotilus sp.]|nr:hypothetical protein [Sphaerotilus sp.]
MTADRQHATQRDLTGSGRKWLSLASRRTCARHCLICWPECLLVAWVSGFAFYTFDQGNIMVVIRLSRGGAKKR